MKTEQYPIVELFDSIEGEGRRTGYMAVFVRFAGCNLRCSYCDTSYAWETSDAAETLSLEQLVSRIHQYPWKRVTLTGGEPMLQDLEPLCRQLGLEGYEVNIETNGAVALFPQRPWNLFYTMDVKSPSSGERDKMLMDNLDRLTAQDVIKFVVGTEADLQDMLQVVKAYTGPARIYLSPVFGQMEPARLVDFVREHALTNVCVQVQLHKVIWDPEARGV